MSASLRIKLPEMRFALAFASAAPPPPPPLETLGVSGDHRAAAAASSSYSPSVIIIIAIIAFVIFASAGIHLLLRYLSRRRRAASSLHPILSRTSSSSSPPPAAAAAPANRERKSLIDSLPLFSLASSLSSVPKSSPDCAVCLSPFRPHDELRLLPACRHAFHSSCVDTWLASTPSCPLCRSSISSSPAPPPAPPLESRSDSFRIEIGSVSRRQTSIPADAASAGGGGGLPPPPPTSHVRSRSYSLGSSFEYVVEEEVEAVLARVLRRRTESKDEKEEECDAPPPPGAEVADAAGDGGRGWLKDYMDRLISSASSSFRLSGRWSHRYDPGSGGGSNLSNASAAAAAGVGGRRGDSWDMEMMEESGFASFYRWLWGA